MALPLYLHEPRNNKELLYGPTAIDWQHPLLNGGPELTMAYICNQGAGDVIDFTGNGHDGVIEANAPGWGVNKFGRMVETTNNGTFGGYGITIASGPTATSGSSEAGTAIFARVRYNGSGGSNGYANFIHAGSNHGVAMNGAGNIAVCVASGQRLLSSSTLTAGNYYDIIINYVYNATSEIWINGVIDVSSNPGTYNWNTTVDVIGYAAGLGNAQTEIDVLYFFTNGLLTDAQCKALTANPYQIMVTDDPVALLAAAGGGGGGDNLFLLGVG